MWLPTSIYERIPQFYVLAGLLLITDGLYLGFDNPFSFFYFGLGIASVTYGVWLFILRINYRKAKRAAPANSGDADSAAADEASVPSTKAFDGKTKSEQSVPH